MNEIKTNEFHIVGKLVNVNIKTGTSRYGNYVFANAVIESTIDNELNTYNVSFHSNEMTKDNKQSELYKRYVSLEDFKGKKVDIVGSLEESRRWDEKRNECVSRQILTGKFIRNVIDSVQDMGTFTMGGFVRNFIERTNKNGEIYRYDFIIGQANYSGDKMNSFTLHVRPEDVEIIRGIQTYKINETVEVRGNIDSKLVESQVADQNCGFGKAVVKTYTNHYTSYFINSGSLPFTGDKAYQVMTISQLTQGYNQKDIEIKQKATESASVNAEETSASATNAFSNHRSSLI